MPYDISYRVNITGTAIQSVDESVSLTGDGLDQRQVVITPGVDREVAVAFTTAALKCICVTADGACTLETNSATAPGNTIVLAADKPFTWNVEMGIPVASVFAADVTKFFFTNPGTVNVTVDILVLKDATP